MKKAEIKLEILTSMYSHGSNKTKMEFRITELKSLLRTTLRELYEFKNLEHMKEVESSLFGDQEHRSPVSFRMKKGEDISNINSGRNITFIIRSDDVDEYITLLLKAAVIGSLGAKSRRGFGSFRIVNINTKDSITDNTKDSIKDSTKDSTGISFSNQRLLKALKPDEVLNENILIQGCKIRDFTKRAKLDFPYLKKMESVQIQEIKNDFQSLLVDAKTNIGKPSYKVEKKILGSIKPRFATAIVLSAWENIDEDKYLIVKILNYDYCFKDNDKVKVKETEQYVNQYIDELIELGGEE